MFPSVSRCSVGGCSECLSLFRFYGYVFFLSYSLVLLGWIRFLFIGFECFVSTVLVRVSFIPYSIIPYSSYLVLVESGLSGLLGLAEFILLSVSGLVWIRFGLITSVLH